MDTAMEESSNRNRKGLNQDTIKYIAMATMLLNHIAHIFLVHGSPLYEIFEDIGCFTAPVMCYFLVEGYGYTRSKKKYGARLLLFAILSQAPYEMAFHYGSLNMIYTLFCCFLILVVMEKVVNPFLRMFLCMLLTFATAAGDWPFFAAVFTILFHNGKGNKKKEFVSFGVAYFLFVLINMQNYMDGPGDWTMYAVIHALFAGFGILAAAVVVLVFYNGRRARRGRNFSKWFFYVFYPAHLLFLRGLSLMETVRDFLAGI